MTFLLQEHRGILVAETWPQINADDANQIGIHPRSSAANSSQIGQWELVMESPHPAEYGLNTSTPVWGLDNLLFISSGYGGGSRVIKLSRADGKTTVEELWAHRLMRIHFTNAIRVGDLVYGSSGDFGPAPFTAVEVKTGKILWRHRSFSRASFLYADDRFIILDEDGHLLLATATPEGLTVASKWNCLVVTPGPSLRCPALGSTCATGRTSWRWSSGPNELAASAYFSCCYFKGNRF